MSLKCRVQITLNNISAKKAQTLKKVLEPDNVNFPRGQSLQMTDTDDRLVLDFKSQGDIKKLIGTIDEIMEHIQVALKVIK